MPTLESRVISGRGLVRIDKTTSEFKKAKIITVFADVIRKPLNEYQNRNYNPVQSRYATLVFLRNTYVIRTEALSYESQAWDFYPDPAAQALFAVQCAYDGILESFANLGTALGLTVVSVVDNIKDWEHEDLFFDEIKVVCYADTGVSITVESTEYELCPEQSDKEPNPPPLIPSPPDLVQPGEPLTDDSTPVSPPYDSPNDNGDTVPFTGDAPDPFPGLPIGTACQLYTCTCTVERRNTVNNAITTFTYNFYVRAPIEGFFLVTGSPGKVQFLCRGANQNLGGSPPACLPAVTLVDAAVQLSGQEFIRFTVEPIFTPV